MFVYIFTFVLSLFSLFLSSKITNRAVKAILIASALLLPAIIAGIRDSFVGTDTAAYPWYVYFFASKANTAKLALFWNNGMVEDAYVLICYYATHFINSFNFFLFVISLITIVGVYWGTRASKTTPFWLFFLFYFMYFNTSLNAQRQAMAMAMCLPCMAYFIRKKYLLAAFAFVLAYLFHHSAALFPSILLLTYIIERFPKIFDNTVTKILVVVGVIGILMTFNTILQYLVGFGLEDKYVARYGSSDQYGSNVPISLLAINIFNYMIFKFITHNRERNWLAIFSEYNMLLAIVLCFVGLISTFAVRINSYFMFVSILLLSYYLPHTKSKYQLFIIAFYAFYWVMVVVVGNLGDTYPYSSQILRAILL